MGIKEFFEKIGSSFMAAFGKAGITYAEIPRKYLSKREVALHAEAMQGRRTKRATKRVSQRARKFGREDASARWQSPFDLALRHKFGMNIGSIARLHGRECAKFCVQTNR